LGVQVQAESARKKERRRSNGERAQKEIGTKIKDNYWSKLPAGVIGGRGIGSINTSWV